MAVYTEVGDDQLSAFLKSYAAGALVRKTPIAEGVENTNYRVETDAGVFILTLFEKRTRKQDLPFFMELTAHLARSGLPVAAPVKTIDGAFIGALAGKPAALIEHLPGRPVTTPEARHCAIMGGLMARLHEAARDFKRSRPNDLSVAGWRRLAAACRSRADECADGLAALIDAELEELSRQWPTMLPQGVVHVDLFPDNVLFEDDAVAGVIDFYFSCTDFLAYDIAICVNAWCFDANRKLAPDKARALISAYAARRKMTEDEIRAFPLLLRGGALRFMLTRLYDQLHQVDGAIVTVKDPLEYRDMLLFHRENYSPSFYGF